MKNDRAYLQLVRLPAVFTAMADIVLGFLLTHRTLGDAPLPFILLLVASACLYMAGMVFNDVFDRKKDARERPTRPIPSGRVSPKSAACLGIGLLLAGNAAAMAVGLHSAYTAAALTLCILAYDGWLKKTPLGPIAMGGCRFLNVMLGAGNFPWTQTSMQAPMYLAAGLGVYIVGVTWFARQEASKSSSSQLFGAMSVVNIGLLILAAFVARRLTAPLSEWLFPIAGHSIGEVDPRPILALLAVIALSINRRLTAALLDQTPQKVQAAVKTMVLSVIMLDATFVYYVTGQSVYAIATAALLIPSLALGRWIYIT